MTPTILQPASRWRWGAPLLVFVAALVPRLIDLGRRPFWLDEVFTLQRASLPPAALVHDSLVNHHMPSFFLMLSPLIRLGDPQLWLRLPPAVFGALAVMLVYLIGSRVAGRMAGVLAALVLGLSPSALAFSQEARSYTMEMCLILVALWGLVGLAANPARAARPWREAHGARGAWAPSARWTCWGTASPGFWRKICAAPSCSGAPPSGGACCATSWKPTC